MGDYYKFIVDIQRTYSLETESIMHTRFNLKDLSIGLLLLDEIRDCYIHNNDLTGTKFSLGNTNKGIESFGAVGVNKINLSYKTHYYDEYKELRTYNNNLYSDHNPVVKTKRMLTEK